MRALSLTCTLNSSPTSSSSQLLSDQVLRELEKLDVATATARVADYAVLPGIGTDLGEGDDWPQLREKVLQADILLLATPIWLGHPSSICQRVLERLNAESSETDAEGRPLMYGKVAAVAVVGNEDGAHKVSADLFQGLNDIGFSLAPGAVTYWVGEAQHGTDYKDLDATPDEVAHTTHTVAANAVHLARLLKQTPYPPS
ncbi:NADPH-dependent oxidoreductase [Streptomyces sp. SID5785]|uniref:flavodoxin family protein n=1 Tax=Streptomyces sp. SID5785 TaxID=2690309 RepID=UPI001360C103|nr:NAD(P)H-dependent oxidoreductase [Streptomyces sp. SID5785]MZD07008.1 NADPH-dependent oxidoreductase [Streptomyces sp. SID5785]MZD09859.1 NADPH-dependent oxidoreductase [Streptomyces sp. SID5785]